MMLPARTDDLSPLLERISSGDRAAFQALYGRTSAKLLGIILRILKDRGRAEDTLQEVFLAVWQRASSYDPEAGKPMSWLITIARNKAIDSTRARAPRSGVSIVEDDDALVAIADPHDEAEAVANTHALRHCLGQLDEIQRRCILDAYYEGFSREELAIRFDRPVNTIKTWLHRSAATLRSCLEEA